MPARDGGGESRFQGADFVVCCGRQSDPADGAAVSGACLDQAVFGELAEHPIDLLLHRRQGRRGAR